MALLLFLTGARAFADELPLRVLWQRNDLVYVASLDSTALVPGDRVTFLERRRVRGVAVIDRRLDAALRVARLTSGSLGPVKRLDRLTVRVEPAAARAASRLRIGLPTGRGNLLFACAPLPPGDPPRGYRADSAGRGFVRTGDAMAAWPDTLAISRFDEAADEEIALERGEIDVAVFWPGELSARMREDRGRWTIALGARARGVLAAFAPPVRDRALFAALNRQLFRDDLLPLPGPDTTATPAGRYAVDRSLPASAVIQRLLDREARSGTESPVVRIGYLDAPAGGPLPGGARALLAVRCAMAYAPALDGAVRAMGADAIADLAVCAPTEREP